MNGTRCTIHVPSVIIGATVVVPHYKNNDGEMAERKKNELLHFSSVPRSLERGRADVHEARSG